MVVGGDGVAGCFVVFIVFVFRRCDFVVVVGFFSVGEGSCDY